MRYIAVCLIALSTTLSCSSDQKPSSKCTADELYDQLTDECVPRIRDFNNSDGGANNQNNAIEDMAADDVAEDDGNVNNMVDPCDQDNDGSQAISCGGDDCNDNERRMSPNNNEFCDDLDNDCSGELNDGVDCTFFAHSFDTLYLVDVFAKTAEVASTNLPNPSLLDIDTHPNGLLYGINRDGLWRYDGDLDQWNEIGQFGIDIQGPNGLAIDSEGTVFVTAGSEIFTVDLNDGSAQLLGDAGQGFIASGDCVVNKLDTLFMTSKHNDDMLADDLVIIDRATAQGQLIGPIEQGNEIFNNVFALTAAFGELYGLTSSGELISINSTNGEAELVHVFPDDQNPGEMIRFFGAASTPNR